MKRLAGWLFAVVTAMVLGGCGYNTIQQADEATKSAWSEVLNQYQRRADLIPNLVATVKGYAEHEREVFTQVTEARSRVGQIQIDPSDPASLQRFENAQRDMGSALARLLVVAENYPQLKADANFRDLQAQLEGTENRITVARRRYIDAVQQYNVLVRQFPVNLTAMVFGYDQKPQFTVENERAITQPPTVDFGRGRVGPAPADAMNSAPAPTAPAPTAPAPSAPAQLPPAGQEPPASPQPAPGTSQ